MARTNSARGLEKESPMVRLRKQLNIAIDQMDALLRPTGVRYLACDYANLALVIERLANAIKALGG